MQVFDWNHALNYLFQRLYSISIITCRSSTETTALERLEQRLSEYQYYNMQVFDWNTTQHCKDSLDYMYQYYNMQVFDWNSKAFSSSTYNKKYQYYNMQVFDWNL